MINQIISGVDGQWSQWSAWSTCSPCTQCTQTRRRACDSPPPSSGGHYCFGVDYDTPKCSEEPACSTAAAAAVPAISSSPDLPLLAAAAGSAGGSQNGGKRMSSRPPTRDGNGGVWVEPTIANENKDAYSIGKYFIISIDKWFRYKNETISK